MNRKQTTTMAFGVAAVLLSGCARGNVNYTIENTQGTTESKAQGTSGMTQFADASKWVENLSATTEDGQTQELVIDADIVLPDTDQMSVVKVRKLTYDADEREKICKTVFGEETVYWNDEQHWPKEKLQEMITSYEKDLEETDRNLVGNEEYCVELEKQIAQLKKWKETAADSYLEASSFDEESYWGYRNGIAFDLDITKTDGGLTYSLGMTNTDYVFSNHQYIIMQLQDLHQAAPWLLKDDDYIYFFVDEDNTAENTCQYSEEEAGQIAETYLAKLGLSDLVCTETGELTWNKQYVQETAETFETAKYGYQFRYRPGSKNCDFSSYGTEENYTDLSTENMDYGLDTQIQISVTDDGVIEAYIDNPIEIISTTDNVQLLPLEQIEKILKEELTEDLDQFQLQPGRQENTYYFNKMELIYLRVKNPEKEEEYSYVPAWRLCRNYTVSGSMDIRNAVFINAMDGSIIHLSDW